MTRQKTEVPPKRIKTFAHQHRVHYKKTIWINEKTVSDQALNNVNQHATLLHNVKGVNVNFLISLFFPINFYFFPLDLLCCQMWFDDPKCFWSDPVGFYKDSTPAIHNDQD